jgi:transposase InsO family protein
MPLKACRQIDAAQIDPLPSISTQAAGPISPNGHLRIYTALTDATESWPLLGPGQVWAVAITYIPMARGFIYLAAVLDWFTRRVLACRVPITLEADLCRAAVEEAPPRHGKLDIFNTDSYIPSDG